MRYAVVTVATGLVECIVFGPDGASSPAGASSVLVASNTANVGDSYADGVFTPSAAS